jgi:hypothetical protein
MQSYYYSIEKLPGISSDEVKLLHSVNITNTQQLLDLTKNLNQQQLLANKLKIKVEYVRKWTVLADLARIKSVGCTYCGLILHSGIISVEQLKQIPASQLHRQILKLQIATMQRRDLCPSLQDVQRWQREAK